LCRHSQREEIPLSSEHPSPNVVVTGAERGLGAAVVRRFVQGGHRVAGLDLFKDQDTISSSDPLVSLYRCDVRDAELVAKTIDDIASKFGSIDIVVNCAGIDHTYWLEQLTVEQFDQIIAVNLRGPFVIAKAVWPIMKRQRRGHIVNIASTAAVRPWTGASAYSASKFGVLGLSRAMNLEGRQDGIRVTTVIPGGMNTSFFERFAGQGIPQPEASSLQDPARVADAIFYAVSQPGNSVVQELVITVEDESSWP
jgi:NAD(P)-dependent dehydrogenase (short-subunit alcohol dehydrogenase family)